MTDHNHNGLTIRPAREYEAGLLGSVALRSKGYWGYDDEFLKKYRTELEVSPAYMAENYVVVAAEDGVVKGFYCFIVQDGTPCLDFFFVDAPYIGQGVGRAMWEDVLGYAQNQGWERFEIVSDPNAWPYFYRRKGCVKIGDKPSVVIEGRTLPLLEYCFKTSD